MPATSLLWNTCARTACMPAKPSFRRRSHFLAGVIPCFLGALPAKQNTAHSAPQSQGLCVADQLIINKHAALLTQVLDPALPAPCRAKHVWRNDSAYSCRCADHAVPCPGSHSRQSCHTPQPHSVGAGHRPAVLRSISQYMSGIHTGSIRTQAVPLRKPNLLNPIPAGAPFQVMREACNTSQAARLAS